MEDRHISKVGRAAEPLFWTRAGSRASCACIGSRESRWPVWIWPPPAAVP